MKNVSMSPDEQKLANWYFAGTVLDYDGSVTAIVDISFIFHEVTLLFRDGMAVLSYEEALKRLKEAARA